MTGAFVLFIAAALAMMIVALAFVIAPPLITTIRKRQKLAKEGEEKGEERGDKNGGGDGGKDRADWRFSLAAAVFVIAVAPGLYWLSGAPESIAPQSDADIVIGILLSAAARAQADGDDKSADLLRQQAQLIRQSSGEQQHNIIRRILQSAEDAKTGGGESQQ